MSRKRSTSIYVYTVHSCHVRSDTVEQRVTRHRALLPFILPVYFSCLGFHVVNQSTRASVDGRVHVGLFAVDSTFLAEI